VGLCDSTPGVAVLGEFAIGFLDVSKLLDSGTEALLSARSSNAIHDFIGRFKNFYGELN